MIDNLFVVESPLQALVALELNLKLKGQRNGIVYRVGSTDRYKNNDQIEKVINHGNWDFIKRVSFNSHFSLVNHCKIKSTMNYLKCKRLREVKQLFIGEFRSQWMHLVKAAINPSRLILMDDGAATVVVKREFIDKGVFYPSTLWQSNSFFKGFLKRIIYGRLIDSENLNLPVCLASSFFKSESLYPVDFSEVRKAFKNESDKSYKGAVLYFGSKYSEEKIISREYEINFISSVNNFYKERSKQLIYCSHRDDSKEKIALISQGLGIEVITPDMPSEVFFINAFESVTEVSAAYSSVLNNVSVLFPNVYLRAFKLNFDKVSSKHRVNIDGIYKNYEDKGIKVEVL